MFVEEGEKEVYNDGIMGVYIESDYKSNFVISINGIVLRMYKLDVFMI